MINFLKLKSIEITFMTILIISLFNCSQPKEITRPSGLIYEIVKEGSGSAAKEGDEVLINETMSYSDGTLLFSTDQIVHPVKFLIGGNQVIDGVDEGVRGMKTGEIRKLIVPPALSKRKEYPPNLSPDSTLYYEIELVEILK